MKYQVLCVKKQPRDDPFLAISEIGCNDIYGNRKYFTQLTAIAMINSRNDSFFVRKGIWEGEVNVVVGKSPYGNECLRTEPNNTTTDNLLSLPECP